MKKIAASSVLVVLVILLVNFKGKDKVSGWNEDTNLQEVLSYLGAPKPLHYMENPSPEMVKMGRDLVWDGKTVGPNGSKSTYVSKHFMCTSCHNMEIEDPNLRFSNPETRLDYAIEKDIPYLQGTTFYGMVNRETWYNDDYILKYGDLVKPAHDNLREAIQLCAKECSQGRPLEQWEEDAILAYSWSLQYKMGDLNLNANNWKKLRTEAYDNNMHPQLVSWLKSFYLQKSPATFVDAPANKDELIASTSGDVEKGKYLYEFSCRQCHHEDGESMFTLDYSKLSFAKLKHNMAKENSFSIYEIVRHGTHPGMGHRPYMPHFTRERMSDKQIDDLKAYIQQEAS